MKDRICMLTSQIGSELDELSLRIYHSPELGYQEYKACSWHTELLRKYGFHIQEKPCGIETGFKAVYDSGKSGLTVAYMAKYDALPGIGHGCGHNILGAASTGAGIVLKEIIDEVGGRVIVFGTPAEETSGAKVTYAEEGEFDDVDIAMSAHPASRYASSGASLALMPVQFEFNGKTAHAAAEPWEGINALDAAIEPDQPRENMGSSDVGQVSHVCPTIHPYFDVTNDRGIPGHTRELGEATLTDYAKEQMRNTVAALALTAFRVMTDPVLFAEIHEEFLNAPK
ncbi:MAG TPA: hypothetical protein VN381_14350 [Anaerovoracaceae bacterium]|nr:hypothetical protein [Anaerovoracaceae bacterium]